MKKRFVLRFLWALCVLIQGLLAVLWGHSYFADDGFCYRSANVAELRTKENRVAVNRGQVWYLRESDFYDTKEAFDFGIQVHAQRGQPIGISHSSEETHENEDVDYDSHYPWLAHVGLGICFSDDNTLSVVKWSPNPPGRPTPQKLGTVLLHFVVIRFRLWELWFLFFLPAILGLFLYVRGKRRSRIRYLTRRCQKCNYDLRASKGRCPECGTPF